MGFPKGASIPFGRERGSNPAREFNWSVSVTHPAQRALLRGDGFFLALYTGLFIMFALAQFSQDTGLLAQFLEASNSALNRFVFSDSHSRHKMNSPPIEADNVLARAKCRLFRSQVKQITFKLNGLDAFYRIKEELPTKSTASSQHDDRRARVKYVERRSRCSELG